MFLFISSQFCVRLPPDKTSRSCPCHSLVVIAYYPEYQGEAVIFLQRTSTSLVHAHAGRTQGIAADEPLNAALYQNYLKDRFWPIPEL